MTALCPSAVRLADVLERGGPCPLGVHLPAPAARIADVAERAVREGGAEFVLLGVPPTRLRETATADVLAVVRQLAPVAPLVVTTHAAPVLRYGVERYAAALAQAGAAGAMVTALPTAQAPGWHAAAARYGLCAPREFEDTASPRRMLELTRAAT